MSCAWSRSAGSARCAARSTPRCCSASATPPANIWCPSSARSSSTSRRLRCCCGARWACTGGLDAMVATTTRAALNAVDQLVRQHRLRWYELLPWLAAVVVYFLLPEYLELGTRILNTVLFALSLDLILGYAGIVTLGHAAFYGFGAHTAGDFGAPRSGRPIPGFVAATRLLGPRRPVCGRTISPPGREPLVMV